MNYQNRLLFIDTETGGLDPTKHSLLSIGLVVWDRYEGIIGSTEFFIQEDKYITTKEAYSIHKIDTAFLETTALAPKTILDKIEDFCHEFFDETQPIPLAGHNTQFDVSFLKQFYKKNNRSFEKRFSHRIVDTYSILCYLFYCGKIHDATILSSTKAFNYFKIKVSDRHSALGDAKATVELFEKLLDMTKYI